MEVAKLWICQIGVDDRGDGEWRVAEYAIKWQGLDLGTGAIGSVWPRSYAADLARLTGLLNGYLWTQPSLESRTAFHRIGPRCYIVPYCLG